MSETTLSDILDRIDDLEVKVDKARANKEETSSSSGAKSILGWLVGLLLAASLAIGAFFLLRNLKKKNEELAKLRTQVEQDKVRQRNLEHDAAVAAETDKALELQEEAELLKERIDATERRIDATRVLHTHAKERILAVQNWEELDALNQEGR